MNPFRGRPPGRRALRPRRGTNFPAILGDPQSLIAIATCIAATLAYFFVRAEIDAETMHLVHAGFAQHFGGMAWTKFIQGGGIAVIQTRNGPARAVMAAMGLALAGFMVFACSQEFSFRFHGRLSFMGAIGLIGLILGLGSLFSPAPRIVTVDMNPGRVCVSSPHFACAPAARGVDIRLLALRENISTNGYEIEVILPDGAARADLLAQKYTQAKDLFDLLREMINSAGRNNPEDG